MIQRPSLLILLLTGSCFRSSSALFVQEVGIRLKLMERDPSKDAFCTEPEKQKVKKAMAIGLKHQPGNNKLTMVEISEWCADLCVPPGQRFCKILHGVCLKSRRLGQVDNSNKALGDGIDTGNEYTELVIDKSESAAHAAESIVDSVFGGEDEDDSFWSENFSLEDIDYEDLVVDVTEEMQASADEWSDEVKEFYFNLMVEEDDPVDEQRRMQQDEYVDATLTLNQRAKCYELKEEVMTVVGEYLGRMRSSCLKYLQQKLRLQCFLQE